MRYRNCWLLVFAGAVMVLGAGCGRPLQPPNSKLEIAIVNDKPNTTALVEFNLCGALTGTFFTVSVPIGADGRGTTGKVETNVSNCSVFVVVQCGSGQNNQILTVDPRREPKRTVNCAFSTALPSSQGWESLSNSLDAIHYDQNPSEVSTMEASTVSPYDEANREAEVRSFLASEQSHDRQAQVLYDLLLDSVPPNETVKQNLAAGHSVESQIVFLVAGDSFFSACNNDHSAFVTKTYRYLFDRDPTDWERDEAVMSLDGYWLWIEEECDPPLCTDDGVCMPADSGTCGHWEWYQITRDEFAWNIVGSHEFRQVAAGFMFGVQLRRLGTSSEIEDQAFYIAAYGLKEGAIRILKSAEFFEKSTDPW